MIILRLRILLVLILNSLSIPVYATTPLEELPRQQFIEKVHALGVFPKAYSADWQERVKQYAASLEALVESVVAVDPALINTPIDAEGNTLLHRITKSDFNREYLYHLIKWFEHKDADICTVNYNGELAIDNVFNGMCQECVSPDRRAIYLLMQKNLQIKMARGLSEQEQRRADILVTQRNEVRSFKDVLRHPGLCHLPAKELLALAQFKGYLNAQLRILFINMLPYYDNKSFAKHVIRMRWLLQHGADPESTGEPHDSRNLLMQLLFPHNYHEHCVPLAQLLLEHGAKVEGDNRYLTRLGSLARHGFREIDPYDMSSPIVPAQLAILLRTFGADMHKRCKDHRDHYARYNPSAHDYARDSYSWLYGRVPKDVFGLFCRAWDFKNPYEEHEQDATTASSAEVSSSTEASAQLTRKKKSLKAFVAKALTFTKRSKKN
jgi:hypothetical protein